MSTHWAESDASRREGVCALLFSTTEAEEVLVSEESVEAGVGLTSLAHETSEGDNSVLGAGHLAIFVNLNRELGEGRRKRTWAISICTEEWSLALMSLLVAEHLRGM